MTTYMNRQPPINPSFKIKDFDTFVNDRFINEDALSFTFDFSIDLRPAFNWNTNLIFAYVVCEFNTSKSQVNQVTIWDQRIPRDDIENHIVKLTNEYPEYYLTDVNKQMRDVEVKVFFEWE